MMRRTAALSAALALGGLLSACGGDSNGNSNTSNANAARSNASGVSRNGVIDSTNVPANLKPNSVPSNTGVLLNNNGNDNTSGVRPINR